ncbi:hypothetical protein [Variovorax sp. LT1R16]|uniref:hypothetical protein n=1 Tax=Variovorax sp. LT1R16 TaxID=3443728 RepID=UPI003F4510A1
MWKIILGVAAAPLLALAMFLVGLLAALFHLIALPVLFAWEHYLETMPLKRP